MTDCTRCGHSRNPGLAPLHTTIVHVVQPTLSLACARGSVAHSTRLHAGLADYRGNRWLLGVGKGDWEIKFVYECSTDRPDSGSKPVQLEKLQTKRTLR